MQNETKGGIDKTAWMQVFEDMTPAQRRWAFVSVKMAERRKTFKDMAKRHRFGAGYLAECVQGAVKNGYLRKLTPAMKSALEAELDIDLGPFMSPMESWNVMASESAAKRKSRGEKP